MENIHSLIELFAGLAIFIYGVHLLSEGLEKVAGAQLLSLLDKSLNHPLKQSFFGMVATALMQSSGLLMVTMIGLINANLLSLQQAIGIMLGQEIGTTITGQMIAFKIGSTNLLFVIIGLFMMFFSKNTRLRMVGQPFFGFGIVFLGMNIMSKAGALISQTEFFQQSLLMLSRHIVLGVLVGAVFTAAIQSSTAMTGLVIAMGKSDSISLPVAIAIILGANIGSCIMGWLAAIQSGSGAKRASYSQIIINICGVLLFLPFIQPFTELVMTTSLLLPRQIANAHTIFNIVVSILMFPMVKPLANLIEKLIPDKEEEKEKKKTRFIDPRLLNMPVMAVQMAKEEVIHMGWIAHDMVEKATGAIVKEDGENIKWVLKHEKEIDQICHSLDAFLQSIPGEKLATNELAMLEHLKHLIMDIERVGDHANNLAEFALEIQKKKNRLTKYGRKELNNLSKCVLKNYALSLKAFKTNNLKIVDKIIIGEDEVDGLEKKYKQNHIERLKKRICDPELDTIYVESLRNLERISDHAINIALSLIY